MAGLRGGPLPEAWRAAGCPCHGGARARECRAGRVTTGRDGTHWGHLADWPGSSPAVAPAACPAARLWTPPVPRHHPIRSLWAKGSMKAVSLSAIQGLHSGLLRVSCPSHRRGEGLQETQECSHVITPSKETVGRAWGKSRPAGQRPASQPTASKHTARALSFGTSSGNQVNFTHSLRKRIRMMHWLNKTAKHYKAKPRSFQDPPRMAPLSHPSTLGPHDADCTMAGPHPVPWGLLAVTSPLLQAQQPPTL